MNNQELVKYIFELAYEHWVITILFIICLCPWNALKIIHTRPYVAKAPSLYINETRKMR